MTAEPYTDAELDALHAEDVNGLPLAPLWDLTRLLATVDALKDERARLKAGWEQCQQMVIAIEAKRDELGNALAREQVKVGGSFDQWARLQQAEAERDRLWEALERIAAARYADLEEKPSINWDKFDKEMGL